MKYKFQFEKSPNKKGTCPQCGQKNSFRYYQGLDRKFGICDRINNCGYKNTPSLREEYVQPQKTLYKPIKTVYPAEAYIRRIIENQSSPFHEFAIMDLMIPWDHLRKWNCGTSNGRTAFIYADYRIVNVVQIQYNENGKRNKNTIPFSLKAKEGERHRLCLYGEHLLSDKTICLVESEKTAVIASFFYPQFDWLATGGANKLTDEKIDVLFNKNIYYLNDADKAGKESSSIKKMKQYKLDFKIIDLFPNRSDGYDLADAIIDGLRPEIK